MQLDERNEAMTSQTRTAFGPARIVAVTLLALAVLGLGYLYVSGGDSSVSVPSGAHAGQLTLHPCHYATEDGSYAADCGTLVVPENRHDAQSRLIALPVTRIRAKSPHPAEPVFRLQGGPGITNMSFADASRFANRRDVVLVGYRGIDGSSKLDCPEVSDARKRHAFLTDAAYRADEAAFKACAARLESGGVDLAGYSLPERVDDLEAARRALGYGQIDLLSESAGTRTALIYAWRYPQRIHRSVMIGVNPPGHFLWDARTTGEQIRRYAQLCAHDRSCTSRTPDLAKSLSSAFANVPKRWLFLPIHRGNVLTAAFFGLNNATSGGGGPIPAPKTIDTMLAAGQGNGSGAWFLSLMAQLAFPDAQVWGEVASTGRIDTAYARRFFAAHRDRGSVMGAPLTDLVWLGGRLVDAWPANPDENLYTHVRDSNVQTLLVGGELDFATPPQNATRELLPHLKNGRQVLLPGLGHTDDFWVYEPDASSRLINTYLDSGRVDTSLYTRHTVDFSPTVTHGTIAGIVLAVLLFFAALTALSLLVLPFRVYRRGALGRKSSAAIRSAYVVLLGLGGWFAAALIVLTVWQSVALDDDFLAALSIGLPIALGTYFAWTHRDWAANVKVIGFAASAAGALVGAWLGLHVVDGAFAVFTAVVGSTVGANATLLGLDIAWDSKARNRFAAEVLRPGLLPR
jgi:pimeloyl-ACP methyl ester carboxylesterase